MRRHGKIDANQPEIVEALRAMGASVQILSDVGDGCPDLLVGYRKHNILLEVKDGNKPRSKRMLTPDQVKWWEDWVGPRPRVVESVQDVKNLFDVLFGGVWETK